MTPPILITNKGLGPNRAVIVKPSGIEAVSSRQGGRLAEVARRNERKKQSKKAEHQNFESFLKIDESTDQHEAYDNERWRRKFQSLTDDQKRSIKGEASLVSALKDAADLRTLRRNTLKGYYDDTLPGDGNYTAEDLLDRPTRFGARQLGKKIRKTALRKYINRVLTPPEPDILFDDD